MPYTRILLQKLVGESLKRVPYLTRVAGPLVGNYLNQNDQKR